MKRVTRDSSIGLVTARMRDGRSTRVTIDYALGYSFNIEAGAVVMLNRSWGVGLTVLKHRFEDDEATTTLSAVNGSELVDGAMRKETAANLELTYVLHRSEGQPDPFDPYTDRKTGYVVRVFGGPTHIAPNRPSSRFVRQELGWRSSSMRGRGGAITPDWTWRCTPAFPVLASEASASAPRSAGEAVR